MSEEITLQYAVDLFLSEQIETTAQSYHYVLHDMLRHLGPACAISDVDTVRLIQYRQAIWKRPYKSGTRYKYVKTVRTFFNWLVRNRMLDESPAVAMKQENLSKEVPESKAMPELALARLLHYASFDPRVNALVRFLADTGCRRGGAAGLRVCDLNLFAREATVLEKGNKKRTVAYGESTQTALEVWLGAHPRLDHEFVFSADGEPISAPAIAQLFRRTCIEAGIGSWGPHALRHRKGHQFARARISPKIAAEALGHTDVRITLNHYYTHSWNEAKQALEDLALPFVEFDLVPTEKSS